MSQALLASHLARSLPGVLFRRLRRGPLRPSWSFGFELVVHAMRRASGVIAARPWVEQRRAYDAMSNRLSPIVKKVTRTRVDAGGVPAEWFAPKAVSAPAEGPVVLYFHGGAYVFGSTTSHAELIAGVALATGMRVLAPNYRLAPDHPFPAAIEDALTTYRWLVGEGVDPSRIVLAGDSAGGGLATALLLRLRAANERMPAGAALVCPWVDLTRAGGSLLDNEPYDWGDLPTLQGWSAAYLAGHDPADPLASPALADLSGLPRLLVQAGEAELLLDQACELATRARANGVDVRLVVEPDMVHDWHSFAGIFTSCQKGIDEIGSFAKEVVAQASATTVFSSRPSRSISSATTSPGRSH